MWLLTISFLVSRLCSVSRLLKFLPSLVSSRRKVVIGLCATRTLQCCDSFRGASDVRYNRCHNRALTVHVGLGVGISVIVSGPSTKVRVVVVFTKNVV